MCYAEAHHAHMRCNVYLFCLVQRALFLLSLSLIYVHINCVLNGLQWTKKTTDPWTKWVYFIYYRSQAFNGENNSEFNFNRWRIFELL